MVVRLVVGNHLNIIPLMFSLLIVANFIRHADFHVPGVKRLELQEGEANTPRDP